MRQRKNIVSILVLAFIFVTACTMSGCSESKEKISLTIWISEGEEELTKQAADDFIKAHAGEADFDINVLIESIQGAKTAMMTNPDGAADIYNFASDQFEDLYAAGLLAPVTVDADKTADDCGGMDSPVIKSVTKENQFYAYPLTSSNGYFLFYNNSYFTEEDVASLDKILSIAASNDKCFSMEFSSGWYLYSFFAGGGKTVYVAEDGLHNFCDFNSTEGKYSGLDIVHTMMDISQNPGFSSFDNAALMEHIKSGDCIAAVSGTWNANEIESVWGEHYAATKLPTFTINGNEEQIGSFAGYKYLGINPKSNHTEWAMKLAQWLTNYDNSMTRFKTIGECPANQKAAQSEEVQKSAAIAALNEQNQYATTENLCATYWDPMAILGTYIISNNPDSKDLQTLLDETVANITKPIEVK